MRKLHQSLLSRVFIEEYSRCWNGAEAARRARYAHPRQAAYKLLQDEDVHKLIDEFVDEIAASADEVIMRTTEIVRDPENDDHLRALEIMGKWRGLDVQPAQDQRRIELVWDMGVEEEPGEGSR